MDDAENTVNYVEIYSLVQSIFENQRFNLIEACANAIASKLLEEFSAIESATVRVKKPSVPVECICEYFAAGGYSMPLKAVYIGLGSNMGDRRPFKNAVSLLERMNALVVTQSSPIYENRAIGIEDGNDFCNAVIEGLTDLTPRELLDRCQSIEQKWVA